MRKGDFTLIDDGRHLEVRAKVRDDRVLLAPEALLASLGWELKPQGLCQGDVCIPVRNPAALGTEDGIHLVALAALLDRPLALETAARAAFLGVSAGKRAQPLTSLEAPNFTLPDLDGTPHSLSDYRGRKVLLLAYASW